MQLSVAKIKEILGLKQGEGDEHSFIVEYLLTDSRKLIFPSKTLFVAIKTSHQDGHHFIKELFQKGVRVFLISEEVEQNLFPKAIFLQVSDTVKGLQKIAAYWRRQFQFPIIGITGSNGKTIVKEWLYQLLYQDYHIVRSPRSYNSQIGVPLSISLLESRHNLGLFEAGISQPGEMENLEKIITPTIGIFTNIGPAHAEGFRDRRQKIREKLRLFVATDLLIYRKNSSVLNEEITHFIRQRNRSSHPIQTFSWSFASSHEENKSDLIIQSTRTEHLGHQSFTAIEGIFQGQKTHISIPFIDKASIENAIHCWTTLLYWKVPQEKISQRMKTLSPVAMRMEMKEGIQNCTLINDSYNSDLYSLQISLDFLLQQGIRTKKTLILTDLFQSGESEADLYRELAHTLREKGLNRLVGIGTALKKHSRFFKEIPQLHSFFYANTQEFEKVLSSGSSSESLRSFKNETILLKGSRSFELENIGRLFEKKRHQSELQINLNAIVHNLKVYQSLLKPGVKTLVMVKAFSYGSGSIEIARLLQFHHVDYLGVANLDEGIELRKGGISLPILILNPDPVYFDSLIQWNLEPEIYSLPLLKVFEEQLNRNGIPHYPIHLLLDTGMHRLGFVEEELPDLLRYLKSSSSFKIASIFSHLAAAEDPQMDLFSQTQARLFEKMSKKIEELLPYPIIRHLANTAGVSRHPQLQYDMIRLGIGIYGIDTALSDQLKKVHTLRTRISQIKIVKKGETIGYGRAGKAETDKRIATVALGYADGYFRSLGLGNGKMLLHHQWVPTIGNICMDMLMLDITEVPKAKEGDSVIVFGAKPTIEEVAHQAGTIPYEILTGFSHRVVRVYIEE